MLSPFLLLAEWTAATGNPQMPGLAALEALEAAQPWPPDCDGEPHPTRCACPDCSDDSPMLEDEPS